MADLKIILFDTTEDHENLRPLTLTRPVSHIRCGIKKLAEKWDEHCVVNGLLTETYLHGMFAPETNGTEFLYIRSSVIASLSIYTELCALSINEALYHNNALVAFKSDKSFNTIKKLESAIASYNKVESKSHINFILHLWDIFSHNAASIEHDIVSVTKNKKSLTVNSTVTIIGNHSVFIEEGAIVNASAINTSDGPVYIGKNAEIMEGCLIRGPFALCEGAVLKMGTKIYGGTTVGPFCKVGGEVSNSVLFGYSNKAHDGFLGNSVIGEWCNLGADTNNSNLKNNYGQVKIWNYHQQKMIDTNKQFCGIFMGDHSKSGINTMFNTGTVIGVSSNIFGGGFPPKNIPSFSWGGETEMIKFDFIKAIEAANKVKERKGLKIEVEEEKILKFISTL